MTTGNGKFEQDLQKIEDGYQALPADEPPDLLDQAVLNKARAAVGPRSTRPWSFGWMHATATVAVLVVGLAVVMQQPTELSAPPVSIDRSEAVRTDAVGIDEARIEEALMEVNRARPARSAVDLSVSGQIKRDAPAVLEERVEEQELTVTTKTLGSSESFSDEPQRQDAGSQKVKEESGFRAAKKSENAPLDLNKQRREQADPDSSMVDEVESETDELRQAEDKRQGLATASMAAPVPASEAVMRNNEADQSAGGFQSSVDDESFASELQNPDDWISRILDMKNEANGDEWLQELEQFRELYPDYPLPEELNRELPGSPPGQ